MIESLLQSDYITRTDANGNDVKVKRYLVRWLSFDDSHNEWIDESDISERARTVFDDYNDRKKGNQQRPVRMFRDKDLLDILGDTILDEREIAEDEVCPVNKRKGYKDDAPYVKQERSCGIVTLMTPCHTVLDITMLWRTESVSQLWAFLGEWHETTEYCNPSLNRKMLYDDACHLHKYSANAERANLNRHTKWVSQIEMFLDRLHALNHVERCQAIYSIPANDKRFKDVNSMACEQYYKWLSAFRKITCNMSAITYELTMYFLISLKNKANIAHLQKGGYM